MVQEVYETNPAIREACEAASSAMRRRLKRTSPQPSNFTATPAGVTARSLALHTQAVLQGAFILAKAKGDAAVAAELIDHLRRYLVLLFRGHSARR